MQTSNHRASQHLDTPLVLLRRKKGNGTRYSIISPLSYDEDWEFSLMLAVEVAFLFGSVPLLSTTANQLTILTAFQVITISIFVMLRYWSRRNCLMITCVFLVTLAGQFTPDIVPHSLTIVVSITYNVAVTCLVAKSVFGPGQVNYHRITGAVFVYLNIGFIFALFYATIGAMVPETFSGMAAGNRNHASEIVHFSLTKLTALGDAGVQITSPLARSWSDLEAIVGQLFPAILISRLVGLHVSRSSPET